MADKNVNIIGAEAGPEADPEVETDNANVETGSEPDTASIERIYRYGSLPPLHSTKKRKGKKAN